MNHCIDLPYRFFILESQACIITWTTDRCRDEVCILPQFRDCTQMAGMLGNIAAFGIKMNQAEGIKHATSTCEVIVRSILVLQRVLRTCLPLEFGRTFLDLCQAAIEEVFEARSESRLANCAA